MAQIRPALILGALLWAAPASAQSPAPDPAAKPGRAVTATGQTKPQGAAAAPSSLSAPLPKPLSEADMIKAQKAAEARSKAWDGRMRKTMGSICNGC